MTVALMKRWKEVTGSTRTIGSELMRLLSDRRSPTLAVLPGHEAAAR